MKHILLSMFLLVSLPISYFAMAAATVSSSPMTTTIVVIGDSIASGYGVRKEEGFPERVEKLLNEKLQKKGQAVKIINGGTPGSLSAGAESRLKWFMKARPAIVVIELGGNDALQGVPVDKIKSNLSSLIDQARQNHIKVLLVGMQVYSNLGNDYTSKFKKMYIDLAKEKKIALMPFLLEGVALDKDLNQADMKHPNAKGHAIIAKKIEPYLEKLL